MADIKHSLENGDCLCAGRYEYETIEMLEKAFADSKSAYDVDNVISQLGDYGNEEINYYRNTLYENCIRECVSKAIEIVKQGGVSDEVCEWIEYDYRTICPKNHDANNPYWRIPDNMDKLKYCPYCGKKIKIVGD